MTTAATRTQGYSSDFRKTDTCAYVVGYQTNQLFLLQCMIVLNINKMKWLILTLFLFKNHLYITV